MKNITEKNISEPGLTLIETTRIPNMRFFLLKRVQNQYHLISVSRSTNPQKGTQINGYGPWVLFNDLINIKFCDFQYVIFFSNFFKFSYCKA